MSDTRYNWHTRNTKIAAALQLHRFPMRPDVQQDERSGSVFTRFWVAGKSLTGVPLGHVIGDWQAGVLEKARPMDPFLQGLRGLHNYEMILDAEKKGRRLRLVGVCGSRACEYRDGEEAVEMVRAAMVWRTRDRALAAAAGTLGMPVIKIEAGPVFTLPVLGHVLLGANGEKVRYNGAELGRRQEGSRDLLLEVTDPGHALLPAYFVREYYLELVAAAKNKVRMILFRPPGTRRVAQASEEAVSEVFAKIEKHLKGR
jgi:hypothetical protein